LSNLTINFQRIIRCWKCSRGNWLCSEFFINIIKFRYFFKGYLNFSIDFLKLFFWKRSFKNFILFHENFWKYLIHINSWNFIKLSLIYHYDKVVHFLWISKVSCPYFEFYMFFFYLFTQIGKEQLHLVLHCVKLWNLCVRIFIKNVLNFTPFHFFTGLVKKSALFSILESIFTDKSRFTTLWIYTNHETEISVYTFWAVFEVFTSHQYIYLCFTTLRINIIRIN